MSDEPSFDELLRQAIAPDRRRAAREQIGKRIFPSEERAPEPSPTAHHGAADAGLGDQPRTVEMAVADSGEHYQVLPLEDIFGTTTNERTAHE